MVDLWKLFYKKLVKNELYLGTEKDHISEAEINIYLNYPAILAFSLLIYTYFETFSPITLANCMRAGFLQNATILHTSYNKIITQKSHKTIYCCFYFMKMNFWFDEVCDKIIFVLYCRIEICFHNFNFSLLLTPSAGLRKNL